MVQRKGFGAGVVSDLSACVFLQMLLDLPREHTWKMGKHSDSPKVNSPKF
jgi:hypothetical protein